jgi:hypothetical protein
MPPPISKSIPTDQLRRLNFLLGDSCGLETLYPPDGEPVQFTAHVSASWEACDRFVRLDFFGEIPGVGVESFRTLITFSETMDCYRFWLFASSQEEPVHAVGDFQGDDLVFITDPTRMVWGTQRLRFTFRPACDGSIELLGERWEPDGYAKYCSVVFRQES